LDFTKIYHDILTMNPSASEVCLRLACAMLVGLVIGTEREYTNRPAGMRTHILVALGACAVSVLGELLFQHYQALGATPDPARLSAQVITGVGFLGAGTIMREGTSVKGLTTAASLWAVACLGIAAGFGYYTVAIAGMVFIFITLTIFELIQNRLLKAGGIHRDYMLETNDISATLVQINTLAAEENASIHNLMSTTLPQGYRITFRADFFGSHSKKRSGNFFHALASAAQTQSLRQSDDTVYSKQ
jgi:putative Mg2+ transporter-C (MgtC) family protein